MKKLVTICFVAGILLALFAGVSNAAFTVYDDYTAFSAAAGGPILTQDFESYAAGDDLRDVEILPGISVTSDASKVEVWSDGTLFAYDNDGSTREAGKLYYEIDLSRPYTAVSFDIDAWNPAAPGPGRMDVLFADASSASIQMYQNGPTENTPVFFGITSDIPITKILWNEGPEIGGVGNEETALDDIAVAVVPAPGAILLGSLGTGFVGWRRFSFRRRHY